MAGFIQGTYGESKTNTGSIADTTTQQTQQQTQQSTTKGTSSTDVASQVSQLDAESLKGLQDLVKNLMGGTFSGKAIEGSSKELAQFLTERAKAGGADIKQQNAAIVGEARRAGELQLKNIQQQLARQSGGSVANTLVGAATGEAAVSLESQLADVQAKLDLQARQTQTEELNKAFGALLGTEQAGAQNLTGLLNVLKGAQTTASQQSFTTSESQTDLSALLESLTQTHATSSSESKGSNWSVTGGASN